MPRNTNPDRFATARFQQGDPKQPEDRGYLDAINRFGDNMDLEPKRMQLRYSRGYTKARDEDWIVDPDRPFQFDDVSSRRGAPMGRATWDEDQTLPCTVFEVDMVDGDYDDGGAYWGGPGPIFCITNGEGFRQFRRANSLRDVMIEILEEYPDLRVVAGRSDAVEKNALEGSPQEA